MKRIRFDKKTICIGITYVYLWLLNTLTPYVADDFQYMYSFATGERIRNVLQIFPSLWVHYLDNIGRMTPHFLVQFFLMMPKEVFNLCNAAMFVALVWMMLRGVRKDTFSALLWFGTAVLIWQFVPGFGQIFLWEDGSCNYLWSYGAGAFFLLPYIRFYLTGEDDIFLKKSSLIGFTIYGLFWGNFSENISFAVCFMAFVFVVLRTVQSHRSWIKVIPNVCPIAAAAVGYVIILLSPGEASHVGEFNLGAVGKNMIYIMEQFYASQKTVIVLWAVLMVLVFFLCENRRILNVSVCLVVIAVINMLMLGFGSYLEARSYAAGAIFLIWAVVILLQELMCGDTDTGKSKQCVAGVIAIYFIAGALLNIWNGSYDIYETGRRVRAREELIIDQAECGAQKITVPCIEAATPYCAKYGLTDLFTEEQNPTWLNPAMAKYYGVDEIYGE